MGGPPGMGGGGEQDVMALLQSLPPDVLQALMQLIMEQGGAGAGAMPGMPDMGMGVGAPPMGEPPPMGMPPMGM